MATKTKAELERELSRLQAQVDSYRKQFSTGILESFSGKYAGVPLPREVEHIVTEWSREALTSQLEDYTEGAGRLCLIDATPWRGIACPVPGIDYLIVRYSFSHESGSFVEKAYKAIKVQ